tara:strand:- start:444 stop:620 length:177 start_codon:yes stop_codon:yes gene_type:complete
MYQENKMINLEEKLNNIKTQQEHAKELFIKCQGAIELLEELLSEENNKNEKDLKGGKK